MRTIETVCIMLLLTKGRRRNRSTMLGSRETSPEWRREHGRIYRQTPLERMSPRRNRKTFARLPDVL